MDHHFIDDQSIAERYLNHALEAGQRAAFEAHLVDCQECTDRVLLAEMFHLRNGSSVEVAPDPAEPQPIHAESNHSAEKRTQSNPSIPALPLRARFVAWLRPWPLFLFLVITALLLLVVPIVYLQSVGVLPR